MIYTKIIAKLTISLYFLFMDTYIFHTLILLSGLLSAYVGMYIAGGISAISIGLLLALGIPPHIANSTYLVGNIGSNI